MLQQTMWIKTEQRKLGQAGASLVHISTFYASTTTQFF